MAQSPTIPKVLTHSSLTFPCIEAAKFTCLLSRSGTPLHTAVYSRGTNIVEYLVKAGADTTITDMRGCTPADLARLRGKQELIPYLEKTP
jgi:ankyrin repeat protein